MYLHVIAKAARPNTMHMMAWISKHKVTLLVDNGSSHNFINTNKLKMVGLAGATIVPFEVKLANGEHL